MCLELRSSNSKSSSPAFLIACFDMNCLVKCTHFVQASPSTMYFLGTPQRSPQRGHEHFAQCTSSGQMPANCLDLVVSEPRLFNVRIWGDFTVHRNSITSASDSQAQRSRPPSSLRILVKKGKTIVSEKESDKNIFFQIYVYIIQQIYSYTIGTNNWRKIYTKNFSPFIYSSEEESRENHSIYIAYEISFKVTLMSIGTMQSGRVTALHPWL